MVALNSSFDHSSVQPADDLGPVPAGYYAVEIIEADESPNKQGTGRMIKLTLRIVDGEFENRRIWAQLNYQHESDVAQRIAQQLLSSLCAAIGIDGPLEDTDQLVGTPVIARVKVAVSKDPNYSDKNEVQVFKPYEAAPPANKPAPARQQPAPQQRQAAAPVRQPAKAAANDRPWTRRA